MNFLALASSWNPHCATCSQYLIDTTCSGIPSDFKKTCTEFTYRTCHDVCPRDSFDAHMAFADFISKYEKNYSNYNVWKVAYKNFEANYDYVMAHMDIHSTFSLGINEFSDTAHRRGHPFSPQRDCGQFKPTGKTVPTSVDHRTDGLVTPVKNQGNCGSCWAFSTTGSVEGLNALVSGDLVSLSEQQLVDCSRSEGDNGCYGGLMDYAFEYIIDNGICTEEDYPYIAHEKVCSNCTDAVYIKNCADVKPMSDEALQEAVAKQPVSVAIEADSASFQSYSGGVYDSPECGTNLDHGVLVVGYTPDYWIVKNSWGESWGENGYINIARDGSSEGMCGILLQPSFPM
uniref:Peptidase C1A papain C-terminal domain-containing protein n=1 Tax=viral metagenome TaxID=1070528 RepID=A0A6C0KA89_9ZZZZ